LPHTVTPVAFVSTVDQSGPGIVCRSVTPRELGQGLRFGYKLARYLELLLP
jgi:hypothetical protein